MRRSWRPPPAASASLCDGCCGARGGAGRCGEEQGRETEAAAAAAAGGDDSPGRSESCYSTKVPHARDREYRTLCPLNFFLTQTFAYFYLFFSLTFLCQG